MDYISLYLLQKFWKMITDDSMKWNGNNFVYSIILEFDTGVSKYSFWGKFVRATLRFKHSLMNRFLIKYDIPLAREVKPTDKGLSCKMEKDRPSGAVRLPPAGRAPTALARAPGAEVDSRPSLSMMPQPGKDQGSCHPRRQRFLSSLLSPRVLLILWSRGMVIAWYEDNVKKHTMKN